MEQPSGITFEAFTMDAYDAVFGLWTACEGVGLSDADSRPNIERFLLRNPGMSFVARDGEVIIGAILAGHDGRRGYLHHLAVHPEYRRRGIGHLLFETALDALRAAGIKKCHGFVFRDNVRGLDFWRAVGWTVREDVRLISKDL